MLSVPNWPCLPLIARLLLVKPSHITQKTCVCLLFHSPCWLLWFNRPMFIGRVVPVYYTTFSHWRNRRMFFVALHIVLLVNSPQDAADDAVEKPSHKYLNPPSPEPFQRFSSFLTINHLPLFRSLQIYLSPLIPRASTAPSASSIRFSLLPFPHPTNVAPCAAHLSSFVELTRCPL